MKWLFFYKKKDIIHRNKKNWEKDIEKWTSEDQTDYPPYCLFPPTQREEEATKHTDNSYICSIFPVIFPFFDTIFVIFLFKYFYTKKNNADFVTFFSI